jgi:hypothetical protein
VEDSGVNGLALMRGPFRTALADAGPIIRKRLSLVLLLVLATLPIAALVASYTLNLEAVSWIAIPGLWTLSFLYYSDAMRLVFDPDYKLILPNVLKLIALIAIIFGLVAIASVSAVQVIGRFHPSRHAAFLLGEGVSVGLLVYFGTKFSFAAFGLKDRSLFSACGRSWMLTTGPTVWPTAAVNVPFYVLGTLVQEGVWAVRVIMPPWSWAALHVVVTYGYATVVWAFMYSLMARWMVECEVLKRPLLVVPPYGNEPA